MDHRRQSEWYKAGMGRGIANGRGGNPFLRGDSAKVSGNTEAQEFVASSPFAREGEGNGAARLPGQRGGDTLAGMGKKDAGVSHDSDGPRVNRHSRREVRQDGIRLAWSNPHMTKATGRKSRAALVICE